VPRSEIGDPPPAETARLRLLATCAALLVLAVVAFDLLYLYLPKDKWVPHGYAPDIGAAYGQTIAVPDVVLGARAFARIALGLQAAMWAAFFAIVYLVRGFRGGAAQRTAFKLIAWSGALAALALLLTPPTLSTDLYRYAVFGRMIITRGLNPYVTPGNALAGDALLSLADNRGIPTHYGPLFTDLSVLAALIGGGGPIRTALAFKLMSAASAAVAAWAIVTLARQQERSGLLPLALFALNPLVLLESAGSGHNEPVMMALALGGLVVAGKGKPNLGFALLVCSMHVKWLTVTLVGLVALARLREIDGWRARSRELATMLAIAVGITVALYLPYWAARGATSGVRRLLAQGEIPLSHYAGFAALVLIAIAVVVHSGRRRLIEMAALTCFGFFLLVFGWLLPWYLIPAIALVAAGPFTRLNATLFVLTTIVSLFLMASYAVLLPR